MLNYAIVRLLFAVEIILNVTHRVVSSSERLDLEEVEVEAAF